MCTKSNECKDGCCTDLYTDTYYRQPLTNITAYLTQGDGRTLRTSYYSLNICIPKTTLVNTKLETTVTKLYPESVFTNSVYYIRHACYISKNASLAATKLVVGSIIILTLISS